MSALKVSIIGSGNWGSAIAKIIGQNVQKYPSFDKSVRMWVFDEQFEGKSLIDIINTEHENKRYLPGILLPENVKAVGDLKSCTIDADIFVFISPHQFLPKICSQMKPHIKSSARGVSFIKGIFSDENGITLITDFIKKELNIPMSVVSGANVAKEVAKGDFAEATLGFNDSNTTREQALMLESLFHTPSFPVTAINDVAGVELSGALKNIIALAAGFVDGLNLGSNTKSAILRIGSKEIHKFAHEFFTDINDAAFWESCGFADIITTCYAGRNRRCAEEFTKTGENWETIEKRLLSGQKLQGPSTCKEIYRFLKIKNRLNGYPLFYQTYKISFGENGQKEDPKTIVTIFMKEELPGIV